MAKLYRNWDYGLIILLLLWLLVFFLGINSNCVTTSVSGFHLMSCSQISAPLNVLYIVLSVVAVFVSIITIALLSMKLFFKK